MARPLPLSVDALRQQVDEALIALQGATWPPAALLMKKRRGFASMDQATRTDIARKGGKSAHAKGTAHEWTADEATAAGRKGGRASAASKKKARS